MREKLIEKIANMWRGAENVYLETEDDTEKFKVLKFQAEQNLTEEELKEIINICKSMGV